MKTKIFLSSLLMLLLVLSACSSDDDGFPTVDGLAPTILLAAPNVKSVKERNFYITGTVSDADGLKSIHLKNTAIYLDKVISFRTDTLVHSFDLNYKFKVKSEVEGESFTIEIVATDVGGRTTEETFVVTMDGDFTYPEFTIAPDENITVLIKTETKFNVKFIVLDNKALDLVSIEIPELSYSREETTFTNSGKTLEFNESIVLPSVEATYTLIIKAVDKAGLETAKNCIISVSDMPDFAKMYLVDVADAKLLNSDIFGIPMLIDRTAAYTYKARYYSEQANTNVRFAPQKTDFSPISFGMDPANNAVLIDDPDISLPIVLPNRGYYEIAFNVQTGAYTVNTYTPTDTPIAIGTPVYLNATDPAAGTIPLELGLVGDGLPNKPGWSTSDPYMLALDANNAYLFYAEMTLVADSEIEFIISTKHSWGWWPSPFWRWDRSADPETNVAEGGENPGKWKVPTSGKYMFKFDTHLKRSKFYPIN